MEFIYDSTSTTISCESKPPITWYFMNMNMSKITKYQYNYTANIASFQSKLTWTNDKVKGKHMKTYLNVL